jgi:hypothetical protein
MRTEAVAIAEYVEVAEAKEKGFELTEFTLKVENSTNIGSAMGDGDNSTGDWSTETEEEETATPHAISVVEGREPN